MLLLIFDVLADEEQLKAVDTTVGAVSPAPFHDTRKASDTAEPKPVLDSGAAELESFIVLVSKDQFSSHFFSLFRIVNLENLL